MLVFASACVISALGGVLKSIRIPSGGQWKNLGTARDSLAISCFILAAFSILDFLMRDHGQYGPTGDILVLFIASCQALLFTMMLIMFIQPLYVRKGRIMPQIAAIMGAGVLLSLSLLLWEEAFPIVLYAAMAGYIVQLACYTLLFNKKYARCLRQLETYYDEEEDERLRWVKTSFYTALSIGIMALGSLFFKGRMTDIFIVVYTAFYVYMTARFINYRNNEVKFVLPAVTRETGVTGKGKKRDRPTGDMQHMTAKERQFKAALEAWIQEKKFSEKDIGVEEIARSLGANSSFLRHYFRTQMRVNFRTWRSELRIREAQKILDANPHAPLSHICEEVGFNDKGNFHRQFQKITGTTPARYKQGRRDHIDNIKSENR
jgi:AraC-like DNA-binding protein